MPLYASNRFMLVWVSASTLPTIMVAMARAQIKPPLPDLAACVGLGLAYGALGALLVGTVLRSARVKATLSLT